VHNNLFILLLLPCLFLLLLLLLLHHLRVFFPILFLPFLLPLFSVLALPIPHRRSHHCFPLPHHDLFHLLILLLF
jgi:hypothetical protein